MIIQLLISSLNRSIQNLNFVLADDKHDQIKINLNVQKLKNKLANFSVKLTNYKWILKVVWCRSLNINSSKVYSEIENDFKSYVYQKREMRTHLSNILFKLFMQPIL